MSVKINGRYPCPFCGQYVSHNRTTYEYGCVDKDKFSIMHKHNGLEIWVFADSLEDLNASWNMRVEEKV